MYCMHPSSVTAYAVPPSPEGKAFLVAKLQFVIPCPMRKLDTTNQSTAGTTGIFAQKWSRFLCNLIDTVVFIDSFFVECYEIVMDKLAILRYHIPIQ